MGTINVFICIFLSGIFGEQNFFQADAYSIHNRAHQLRSLKNYEIITPRRIDGRLRRDVSTFTENGHITEPSFILQIGGEEHILDMRINDVLFADGFFERSHTESGSTIDTQPHRTHHCYYQGEVRGQNFSQVALSTCNGLSGLIFINGQNFYIEPLSESDHEHLIYKPEDIEGRQSYSYNDLPEQYYEEGKQRLQEMEETNGRTRRDVHSETKYVELVLVADRTMVQNTPGGKAEVVERCKTIANLMDLIYQALNTRVALALVEVWSSRDQIPVSSDPSRTLGLFQNWRKQTLVGKISHDNAQLITGVNFDGSTVGMAGVSTMCSLDDSCGVSQNHGNHENDVASTIAHEMGHNLGLLHDKSGCNCVSPSGVGCIMTASSGANPPTNWSSCSVEMFAENLQKGLGACMFNYPKVIFDGPICGNGFLEKGEQCDCGSPEDCVNPCCVPETCTLHENATCAIGECCEDCQLKSAGSTCRNMMNECDLPEYCTGVHEECPPNVYRQNGVACTHKSDQATCFNGRCMTYDDQCQLVWGDGASMSHPSCWQYNQQGNSFGNCGQDDNNNYLRCAKKDRFCGKLYCEGGAGFPILGTLASAQQVTIGGHSCKAASVDQGQDVPDPGYVANGSPCGDGMICFDFKCVNYSMAGIVPCKDDCNGRGICNSNNNCHCNDEWSPPYCQYPGYGGSIDSGPAKPSGPGSGAPRSNILLMIILLVLLIPAFVIGVILAIWKRDYIKEKAMEARTRFSSSPKRPPPPKPDNWTTQNKIPQKNPMDADKYRWPDETSGPTKAPTRPPGKFQKIPNGSSEQPSVAVIQPKKTQPVRPAAKPSPNVSRPAPPAKPQLQNPAATQRAALKPVGQRPATQGPKPVVPKRPTSGIGSQNNNWNNSKPSSTPSGSKPARPAPAPPKK